MLRISSKFLRSSKINLGNYFSILWLFLWDLPLPLHFDRHLFHHNRRTSLHTLFRITLTIVLINVKNIKTQISKFKSKVFKVKKRFSERYIFKHHFSLAAFSRNHMVLLTLSYNQGSGNIFIWVKTTIDIIFRLLWLIIKNSSKP